MRLAVGLTCWQDGDLLFRKSLASILPVCDLLIVADGRVEGVPDGGLGDVTPGLRELVEEIIDSDDPNEIPQLVFESKLWPSNSEKLTWLLDVSREHGAEWILTFAADEELRHAHLLPGFLDGCGRDCWPIPFYYGSKTRPEDASLCPSKLIRVKSWRRFLAGSNVLEHANGTAYRVPDGCSPETLEDAWYLLGIERIPYLDHHPDLRPEGRRAIRFVDWEMDLEPPTKAASDPWPAMVLAPHPFLEGPRQSYRCDQCGRRYRVRGVCRAEHPPAELVAEVDPVLFSALVGVDETQVADSVPVEGWYCDQCGKRFPIAGTCDGTPKGQHEETTLKPLGPPPEVTAADEIAEPAADAAAASAVGDEPADATGSPAQAGEHEEAVAATDEGGAPTGSDVAAPDAAAASSPEPAAVAEPSALEKAKGALEQAAQAIADAISLVASKIEE